MYRVSTVVTVLLSAARRPGKIEPGFGGLSARTATRDIANLHLLGDRLATDTNRVKPA